MNGRDDAGLVGARVNLRRAEHARIPDQRRIGVDEAGQHRVVTHEVLAEQKLADAHAVLGALGLGHRAHERLVGIFEMRVDHLEMPFVDRQIDRLAHRAAGMVDVRAEVGELDEVLEVLERAVAAAFVEVVDERRAVIGREHHRVAADRDVALGIARVLHILRRRGGAQLPRQAARKAHPLALDVAARAAKEFERAGKLAKLDADFLKQRLGVALDRRQPLLADHFGERNFAGDVGDGGERGLRARASARLAATARLSGGSRRGVGHGVSSMRSRAVFMLATLRQGVGELNPQNSVAGIKSGKANTLPLDEPRRAATP